MKNQELFDKTVAILVKAYMEDTLEHTNCYACAVQNIVAANMGYKITPKPALHEQRYCEFITVVINGMRYEDTLTRALGITPEGELTPDQKKELASTGYSMQELIDIENAFEYVSSRACKTDEYVLKGLMAVVDALMLIHEATPTEAEEAKKLFIKQPQS